MVTLVIVSPIYATPTVPFPTQPGDSPYNPPHQSTLGGSSGNALRLSEETDIIIGPPWSSDGATGEIGESSQAGAVTSPASPVHIGPRFTDGSPPGTVAVAQDVPIAATLSHPLGGTTQRDIVTPYAEPDIGEILPTACTPAPTPTLASAPESAPLVPEQVIAILRDRFRLRRQPSLPTSSVVGFPTPASHRCSMQSSLPSSAVRLSPRHPPVQLAMPRGRAHVFVDLRFPGVCVSRMQRCNYSFIPLRSRTCSGNWAI